MEWRAVKNLGFLVFGFWVNLKKNKKKTDCIITYSFLIICLFLRLSGCIPV